LKWELKHVLRQMVEQQKQMLERLDTMEHRTTIMYCS
jgi:alcohol dehydrogenase YqhD (iron-dependent ADH family)